MELVLKLCKIPKYHEQDCTTRVVVELRQDGIVEIERAGRVRNGSSKLFCIILK